MTVAPIFFLLGEQTFDQEGMTHDIGRLCHIKAVISALAEILFHTVFSAEAERKQRELLPKFSSHIIHKGSHLFPVEKGFHGK